MQTDTGTEKKRLLIIDDDTDMLEILQTYFTDEGMDVTVSEGSNDILHLIDECRPHVVILDYLLKGVNGGELCHQVKSSKKYGHIPVAIFSAYPRVLQSLGTYGCNLFIPKPFDLDVVKHHVEKLISDNDKDSCLMKQKASHKNPGIYAR